MGRAAYPKRDRSVHHDRCRRQQRLSVARMEGRPAARGRRASAHGSCLALSAGHEQVEQDRASAVLPPHGELARPCPGDVRNAGRSDRPHADRHGAPRAVAGQASPPDRCRRDDRRDGAVSPSTHIPSTAIETTRSGPEPLDHSISIGVLSLGSVPILMTCKRHVASNGPPSKSPQFAKQ